MSHEIKFDVKSRIKVGQHTLFSRLKNYSVGLLIVSFLSAFFSSFGANYIAKKFLQHDKKNIESTIQGKVLELEEAKVTLDNLIKFIDKQQDSLHELSANLDKIKREKKEIEPILSLSKEQARAVLESYESRINIWEERGWGFAIGLLTSVLGGFILLYSSKIHIFKKKQSD